MTWVYAQSTGVISQDGVVAGCGYSGKAGCKNDPNAQSKHNLGPIPQGTYRIEKPKDTIEHGPYVMQLCAAMDNRMYGRSGFLIHGDSLEHPGDASEGCIILDHPIRERIWSSGDHELQVTS